MTGTRSLTSVSITAIVVVLALLGVATLATTVGASSHEGVEANDPTPGVATHHSWIATYDGGTHVVQTVTLNYSGTGANLSAVQPGDLYVLVDGSIVPVDGVSVGPADEVLTVDVDDSASYELSDGQDLYVGVRNDHVVNPGTSGDHPVSITTGESGSTFLNDSFALTVYDTGAIEGTITNETGTPISNAEVQLDNSTDFTTVTTNDSGFYRGSGLRADYSYTVRVSKSGYVSNSTASSVLVPANEAAVANLTLDGAGAIAGWITNESGSVLANADVRVYDPTRYTYRNLETDANGTYRAADLSADESYTVEVSKSGYASNSTSGLSVTKNDTTTVNVTLTEAATIEGWITNESGGAISGATVDVTNETSVTAGGQFWTNAAGYFRATGLNPEYTFSVTASELGYAPNGTSGVGVTAGAATTQNLTLGPGGAVSGTVTFENGTEAEGAQVWLIRDSGATLQSTGENGDYTAAVATGTYTVQAETSGFVLDRSTGETVTQGNVTRVDFTLRQGNTVSGQVVNETTGNPVGSDAFVMVDGPVTRYAGTDGSGRYTVTVPDGDYTVTAFTNSGGTTNASASVSVSNGASATADLGLVYPSIDATSVSVVENSTPVDVDNLSVSARLSGGIMMVQLVDESGDARRGMPNDLESLGVDESTRFEIDVTVDGYDPNALLWGVRNVNWTTVQNGSNPNATDVTIRTDALHLAGLDSTQVPIGPIQDKEPEEIVWPSGSADTADFGWNRTVYFGLFDMSNVPAEFVGNVEGTTIATNAQTFTRPKLTSSGLEVYVGAPHDTTYGAEHEGYYDAFVPDAQLDEWNVDDPSSELEALYRGSSETISVEETSDGAWIRLDIGYSGGLVQIQPSLSNGGGGGGGFFLPPSGDDTDSSDDTDDNATDDPADDEPTDDTPDGENEQPEDGQQPDDAGDDTGSESEEPDDGSSNGDGTPGFGTLAAVLALFGALGLRARREG